MCKGLCSSLFENQSPFKSKHHMAGKLKCKLVTSTNSAPPHGEMMQVWPVAYKCTVTQSNAEPLIINTSNSVLK